MAIVYLVGAGPGDPGLITVKGAELLSTADVVVYDYLAAKALLRHCKPDVELYYVGKKGGDHTLPQDQINALLVQKAAEGKGRIVRLKGGDPYVFGRGGEEAEELMAAGFDFEVVPGVTSGVAGPAYAGIPVTHRDYASSVSLITGHESADKDESVLDWEALARSASTLVFYMGVKNLPSISEHLIKAGMDPDMPAALVRWGTTCRQRSFVSTIAKLPGEALRLGYAPPSILVVGKVCQLKSRLDWFEKRPLLGKGVVVTRAREQASELLDQLTALGACGYEFPTIAIGPVADEEPVEKAALGLSAYDWVVFTSVNGVERFFAVLDSIGLDSRAFAGVQVAAIGPATAERLRARGIRADFVPEKYVAESIVQGMLALGVAGKKVLIPRAAKAREVLPEELAKAGALVEVVAVYETTVAAADPTEVRQALENREIDYVTFTSSSTVENFFERIPAEEFKAHREVVKLVCIGPVTARTLERFGFTADMQPEDYTIPGLVAALVADATAGRS